MTKDLDLSGYTPLTADGAVDEVMFAFKTLVDRAKKLLAYNAPLEQATADILCVSWLVVNMLQEIAVSFIEHDSPIPMTPTDCILAVMEKLSVRYKDGYTDQAAADRADVVGEEDDARA